MPRFFVTAEAIADGKIEVTGEDAHHIARVLRMGVGDALTVCDMARREYACRISEIADESVIAEILGSRESDSEPPYRATVYMALPKGDKMETVVRKSVELGAARVVPVVTSRCVSRLDPAAAKKKVARWQKIADAAASQCGRGVLPRVKAPLPLREALREARGDDLAFICYEGEEARTLRALLSDFARARPTSPRVSFFVGPEGGYSAEEIALAREAGLPTVTLGRRILRCETAPLAVLANLAYEME